MSESSPPSPPASSPSHPVTAAPASNWMAWVLVACTAAVFWPVTSWILQETAARQQIRQSLVLLAAAAILVGFRNHKELRLTSDLGNRTLGLLGLAFGFVGAARMLDWPLLVLPGLGFGLAGSLQALFGANGYRFFKPLVVGVVALSVIIVLFPLLDWPLRKLAGVEAARVLTACNIAPSLSLAGTPEDPQLLLTVGKQVFHVATECNGFGLITSGALLALLAAGISQRSLPGTLLVVPLAMVIGFAVNLLRILLISLNAPYFPGHYHALHEIIGTLSLWLGLGVIGLIAWKAKPSVKPPRKLPAV
jgi:exosortase/archaeosortase family protein